MRHSHALHFSIDENDTGVLVYVYGAIYSYWQNNNVIRISVFFRIIIAEWPVTRTSSFRCKNVHTTLPSMTSQLFDSLTISTTHCNVKDLPKFKEIDFLEYANAKRV